VKYNLEVMAEHIGISKGVITMDCESLFLAVC
jgi:hypothetical protein